LRGFSVLTLYHSSESCRDRTHTPVTREDRFLILIILISDNY
jgi:hypothetical protein